MTQKSANRQKRDEELSNQIKQVGLNVSLKEARKMKQDGTFPEVDPNNKCWDQLQALHTSIQEQMSIANMHLAQAFEDTSIIPYLENSKEVTTVMRGHANDLRSFGKELDDIYKQHKDLHGGMTNQDDLFKAFNIGEAYGQFQTRYSYNIMPNVNFLIDAISRAKTIYEAVKVKEEASNIEVVTDVVFKEVKSVDATEISDVTPKA